LAAPILRAGPLANSEPQAKDELMSTSTSQIAPNSPLRSVIRFLHWFVTGHHPA